MGLDLYLGMVFINPKRILWLFGSKTMTVTIDAKLFNCPY
jgi:hypothetical protein